MRRSIVLAPSLLLLCSLAVGGTRGSGGAPGKALSASDLLSIYRHWFDSPYRYMFQGPTRLTVGQRPLGEFVAGIDGIMSYGGLAEAIAVHLGRAKPPFGDLRPVETLSGLKIHRRRGQGPRDFDRFDPAIIRWGYRNLIPAPSARLRGHTCQELYDRIFARFFRLMAASHQYLAQGGRMASEQRAYLRAMKRPRFDGIDYLRDRFAGALPAYDLPADGTRFTASMAIGFWIRRGIDGTARELWLGLGALLKRYDRPFWDGLTKQPPPKRPPRASPVRVRGTRR